MEYGNCIWSNGLKKYMNKIENVQRKYTKHVKGLSKYSYEERLKKLKLPSLEYRLIRGDMIQVYKIAHNHYDPVTTNNIFTFSNNSRLRGHNFKIIKQRVNKTKYSNFFTNRVVNDWNSLPHKIVNAKTIDNFKNLFDEYNIDIQFRTDISRK